MDHAIWTRLEDGRRADSTLIPADEAPWAYRLCDCPLTEDHGDVPPWLR